MALTVFRGRKAVFFTLIAILIVSLFVMYFRMQMQIPIMTRTLVAESRITAMNDFVDSFENVYAPRALYAVSHRSLGAITTYITWKNDHRPDSDDTKFFVQDINWTFGRVANESILYDPEVNVWILLPGMVEGKDEGGGNIYLDLDTAFHRLADVAEKEMNIVLDVNVTNIYLEQDYGTGPWRVRAVMEMEYSVNTAGIAGWKRVVSVENGNPVVAEFDISGFIDPYIAAMTNGVMNRTIRVNKLTPRQINTEDEFLDLVRDGNYTFENYSAPSFLFRFEGNTSPSYCCGMESFVLPTEVSPQDDGDDMTEQCGDGLDNDADGYVDLADPDCEDETVTDEFGTDKYGNSYLDFQFWRGRCYDEEFYEEPNPLKPDSSGILWLPEPAYIQHEFAKLDSYHRFKVYPNVGSVYLTIAEYNAKYADVEGFEPISVLPTCSPKYEGCDGCT